MKNIQFILCIFFANYYRAHVIPDNSLKTIKCERYENPSYSPPTESDTNSYDYAPDVETCSSDGGSQPFCFTLWSNDSKGVEIRRKGCFPSTDDCSSISCVSHGKVKSLHFCCCDGDLCNREFFYEPVSVPNDDDDNQLYDLPMIPKVLIIIVFIVSCILAGAYALRRRHYSCISDKHRHIQIARNPSTDEGLLPVDLIEVKAQGKFGTVWKAKYKNNFVAVKILPAEYHQLWLNELEVFNLPKLGHENIVQFIAGENHSSTMPKEYWIFTAYQELGSLHDYLKLNTVTWEQLCIISFTMARGLAHLHEEIPCEKSDVFKPSIAHRDFKSANVLLKSDLTACIADFGFAYVFRRAMCDSHRERIGTKRYMAPEILDCVVGFSNCSFLCVDMYACALVLWEILSRCTVHEDAESKYKLPYVAELGESVSHEALQEFVSKKKGRPVLKETWKNNTYLSNVCEIIEDCWDHDAEARLSAACVTERFSWYLRSAINSDTKLIV